MHVVSSPTFTVGDYISKYGLPSYPAYDKMPALSFPSSSTSSATVPDVLTEYDELYAANREWAEEQAQKQMDYQTSANKIAMDFSSAEADKARAWEAEMANSAYQRAVADLKAAGLNPILAYSQGGAAVPSVSAAQGVSSSGSIATMADTGYEAKNISLRQMQLYVEIFKILANSATSLAVAGTPRVGYNYNFKG